MTDLVQFMLLGLGGGAVIAALASGLVLTYRAAGVVNFAHAAMGTWVAFSYLELRRNGDLLLPVLGLPGRVSLLPEGYRFSWGTALVIALALAALYGLVVHLLVFRPLRTAPALAKVVAALGLFLYLLAMADMRTRGRGAALAAPENLLPDDVVTVLGMTFPQDRLWLAGLVVVATACLAALYRWTRFGLATRAAAESEKAAILLGHSPDRLAAVNWMLASVLAGAAVILVAPIAGLDPSGTSLLIVPALAAALLGGFGSFVATTSAGLGIGMVQSGLLHLRDEWTWLPDVGLAQGLPFLLIVAALVWRGEVLPGRGSLRQDRMPRAPEPVHVARWTAVAAGAAAVGLLVLGSEWRQGIIVSAVTALLALSVVVLTGLVGQISLMPMALAGIAAFAMVKLTVAAGIPFPISPLLASLVAVAVGLAAGLPAARLRGTNLAVATLAAAVAIEELILRWDWFTGGRGGVEVPAPTLGGLDLGAAAVGAAFPRPVFGMLCVMVVALAAVAVCNLRRGSTGMHWLAVRSNERAAAAAGIDVRGAKLSAFALSSFLAGLGGTLLAYSYSRLSAGSFAVFQSLALLAVTYIAGIAGVVGALLAGLLAQGGLLTVAMGRGTSQAQFALNGLLLIVVAIAYPDGITGAARSVSRRVRQIWTKGSEPVDGTGRPSQSSGEPATPGPVR